MEWYWHLVAGGVGVAVVWHEVKPEDQCQCPLPKDSFGCCVAFVAG